MEEVSEDLKQKVLDKVKEIVEQARYIWNWSEEDFKNPIIRFNEDRKGRAGTAHYDVDISTIKFNPYFLNRNEDKFIRRTVPHEIAHIITRKLYGYGYFDKKGYYHRIRPHGVQWKEVMKRLGVDDISTYHSYACPPRKRYKRYIHIYCCIKCGQICKFNSRAHNRIQRKNARIFKCQCGGDFQYEESYSI